MWVRKDCLVPGCDGRVLLENPVVVHLDLCGDHNDIQFVVTVSGRCNKCGKEHYASGEVYGAELMLTGH